MAQEPEALICQMNPEGALAMDYHLFVSYVEMPCCVISVEKKADGSCGEIRIVCSNQSYKEMMGPAYYDNMPYYELVPQDNKFEEFCFRAAVLKQRMHAYVETKALGFWTDQTLIPLVSDQENIGYCQFIFEFTKGCEADRMADVSINTAGEVIKASIKLMGQEHFTDNVGKVLEDLLTAAEATASRIMLVDHDRKEAKLLCEKSIEEAWPERYNAENIISYELIKTWEDAIGVSNAVIVKDEHDMAELAQQNPLWANSMRENGVTSLVLIPLRGGKDVIGYLYVVNFNVEKVVEVKELVELMAFFLGGEIYNHLLVNRLEELSSVDELTGLNNRRAMIRHMRRIDRQEKRCPFGVINIDLNGLKIVNDKEGHEAGDKLLVQAAELLRKVFYHEELFRTGGDEFIVISAGIEKEVFERKVNQLRLNVDKNADISFAIGTYWSNGDEDTTMAIKQADEAMYEDKKRFYEANPELRRK